VCGCEKGEADTNGEGGQIPRGSARWRGMRPGLTYICEYIYIYISSLLSLSIQIYTYSGLTRRRSNSGDRGKNIPRGSVR